jgi:surface polysaccharide O-acyltransferase-like enzyme
LATLRTPANGLGLLALGLLPLVCSRSVYPDLLSLKTLGYFLGAYALGMYIGQYLDATQRIIRRYRAELCLALLAFSSANFLLFVWEYRPDGFVSWHQSVVYVQKVLMALLALHLLQHRGESQPRLLGVLGTHAFSLYFLHMTFVWILCDTILKLKPELHLLDMLWAGALIYLLSIIGSLLVSMALRKILGRRSRWLIGA